MSKVQGKTKSSAVKKTAKSAVKVDAAPDAALIGLCIRYAQTVASISAAFDADPSGDCINANKHDARLMRVAAKLLAQISALPASAASGINAKARLVSIVMKHDGYPGLGADTTRESLAFYQSLAADVLKYTGPLASGAHDRASARMRGYSLWQAGCRLNAFCIENGIPQAEQDAAFETFPRADESPSAEFLAFCDKHGVTLDWLLMGTLPMRRTGAK